MSLLTKKELKALPVKEGDLLVCDTAAGTLELVRARDAARIDLNACIVESGATDVGTDTTCMFNHLTFGQMASVIAFTHGLYASEVAIHGSVLSSEFKRIH